jgi:hypothetical protein
MITKAKELLDKFKKFEYMYSYGLYNIYQNFIYNGFYNLGLYIEKINEMIKLLDEIILLYPELLQLWRRYRNELDYCMKFKPLSVSAHMTLPLPENSRPRRPIGEDDEPQSGPSQRASLPMPPFAPSPQTAQMSMVRPRRPIVDDELQSGHSQRAPLPMPPFAPSPQSGHSQRAPLPMPPFAPSPQTVQMSMPTFAPSQTAQMSMSTFAPAQMSMTNQNVVQGNQSLSYKEKYLKYKQKYLKLKNEMNQ